VPAASPGRTTYPTMSHLLVNESGNVIPDNLVDDIINVFGSRATLPYYSKCQCGLSCTDSLDESVLLPKDWLDPTLTHRLDNNSARPIFSNDPVDENMSWG
jgi:hypothetical protein